MRGRVAFLKAEEQESSGRQEEAPTTTTTTTTTAQGIGVERLRTPPALHVFLAGLSAEHPSRLGPTSAVTHRRLHPVDCQYVVVDLPQVGKVSVARCRYCDSTEWYPPICIGARVRYCTVQPHLDIEHGPRVREQSPASSPSSPHHVFAVRCPRVWPKNCTVDIIGDSRVPSRSQADQDR